MSVRNRASGATTASACAIRGDWQVDADGLLTGLFVTRESHRPVGLVNADAEPLPIQRQVLMFSLTAVVTFGVYGGCRPHRPPTYLQLEHFGE